MEGCIFNIQRFTVHDGPGIRTEVFLKGCPLSCPWCSNPEGQAIGPEPGVYPSRCLGRDTCGLCEQALEQQGQPGQLGQQEQPGQPGQQAQQGQHGQLGLVAFDNDGKVCSICRETGCDWENVVRACPAGALKVWGEQMSVDEVMRTIEKDRRYYETSGGGVTVSGGEPLVQAAFTRELLAQCRTAGIHTCLETTLCAPWDMVEPLIDEADLLIADLKCADSKRHERFTGQGNEQILENLVRAAQKTDQIIIRIPVIPGFNDDADELEAMREFLQRYLLGRISEVQILEFMHLGEEKCRSLERRYSYEGYDFDREELHGTVLALQQVLQECGFSCTLGGAARKEQAKS